jgi:hypothetical protein
MVGIIRMGMYLHSKDLALFVKPSVQLVELFPVNAHMNPLIPAVGLLSWNVRMLHFKSVVE